MPVMQERCCYLNSYALAVEQPARFTYFEGYASTLRATAGERTMPGASIAKGRVVDPTWANFTSERPGAYLALPIRLRRQAVRLPRVARHVRRMAS